MTTLEIPVKFQKDDIIYATKQEKVIETCNVCEGSRRIKYNNKDMKCPECNGKGKFTSNKFIHKVFEEPFIISTTKISINNSGSISVKHKGHCGSSILNRSEENLFSTKKEAQARCDELNSEKAYININDIVIKDYMSNSRPSPVKMQEKLDYYNKYGVFQKHIVVDKNNVLQDGYIIYLLSKLLGFDKIKVIVSDTNIKKLKLKFIDGESYYGNIGEEVEIRERKFHVGDVYNIKIDTRICTCMVVNESNNNPFFMGVGELLPNETIENIVSSYKDLKVGDTHKSLIVVEE